MLKNIKMMRRTTSQSIIIKLVTILFVVVVPVLVSWLIYFLVISFVPTYLENKELFSGITSALVVFSLSKIVELFITAINRKFQHLSGLNKSIVYMNRLNHSVNYNVSILKARKSSIQESHGSFYSNELDILPILDDYQTKFAILNLEIINKSEELSYFITHCNRKITTNTTDYKNLNKYCNEMKEKLTEEQKNFYRKKFIENTQRIIDELGELQIDLVMLLCIISNRFDQDCKDPDIVFFNLFFPQAKEKATAKSLIVKFQSNIQKELKINDKLSEKILKEIADL